MGEKGLFPCEVGDAFSLVDVQCNWLDRPLSKSFSAHEAAPPLFVQATVFCREPHPNNLVPLSKRCRVTELDLLGLEPMDDPVLVLTSGDDLGAQMDCRRGMSPRGIDQ